MILKVFRCQTYAKIIEYVQQLWLMRLQTNVCWSVTTHSKCWHIYSVCVFQMSIYYWQNWRINEVHDTAFLETLSLSHSKVILKQLLKHWHSDRRMLKIETECTANSLCIHWSFTFLSVHRYDWSAWKKKRQKQNPNKNYNLTTKPHKQLSKD